MSNTSRRSRTNSSGRQMGLSGIFRNVISADAQMFGVADNCVEAFVHPQRSLPIHFPIEHVCGE